MKLKVLKFLVLAVFLSFPVSGFASFIDTNTNLSAEWTRMQARAGSYDSIDAISYNPAGTVKKDDGFYMSLQNQILPKSYNHAYKGQKYESTNPTFIVPGFFALHKKGKWSQFGGLNVVGGGGFLEYKHSIFTKTEMGPINLTPNFKSAYTSVFVGALAGGAYQVNEKLSVSVVGRVIRGLNKLEIEEGDMLTLEKTAIGFAPIVGVNYSFSDRLNFGFRHEFRTKLEFEIDELSGPLKANFEAIGLKEGHKNRKDFPALTTIGVTYMLTPKLKLAGDFLYCWHENVTWDEDPKADNGIELCLAAEYEVIDPLKVSIGYTYQDNRLDKDDYTTVIGKQPYNLLATGFAYSPSEKSTINFGVTKLFFKTESDSRGIKYAKDLWIFGMSLEYKFW